MTAHAPRPKKPVPIGSFMMRRVFRQDNFFFCGICRRHYKSADEAHICLESCWKSVLKQAPWTSVTKLGKTQYECVYCRRSYETQEMAAKCGEDCSAKMTISNVDEQNMFVGRAKRVFSKGNLKVSVHFPFKISSRSNESKDASKSVARPSPETAPKAKESAPKAGHKAKESATGAGDEQPVDDHESKPSKPDSGH